MQRALYIVAGIVLLSIIVLFMINRIANRVIFQPCREGYQTRPRAKYQEITLETNVSQLRGWYVPCDSQFIIIFFHGNAGNIDNRQHIINFVHDKLQLNLLIYDYPGYGESTGECSESNLVNSGIDMVRYAKKKLHFPYNKQVLFGNSLGAAVAIQVAARMLACGGATPNKDLLSAHRLILQAPFSSTCDFAPFPLNYCMKKFHSIKYSKEITIPTVVAYSEDDEIVKPAFTKRLLGSFSSKIVKKYLLRGLHNSLVMDDDYAKYLKGFILSVEK